MLIDFNAIPEQSKVWIFPSSRKFYTNEIPELKLRIEEFLRTWSTIEFDFNCAYELRYDRFIIISVEATNQPLSIAIHDALTDFIQGIEKELEIILFDKINVCFKQGDFVQYKELKAFKKLIKAKGVSSKTIVFNNMINTKEELDYEWEINIMESWLGRFLN